MKQAFLRIYYSLHSTFFDNNFYSALYLIPFIVSFVFGNNLIIRSVSLSVIIPFSSRLFIEILASLSGI